MNKKVIKVNVERGNDGCFSAFIPNNNSLDYGLIGEGSTIDETIADFKAVYEGMRDFYKEQGKYFKEVDFQFIVE